MREYNEMVKQVKEYADSHGGIRATARQMSMHENTLYKIVSGYNKNPTYKNIAMINEFLDSVV